jgi:hypothetical protein
MEKMTQLTVMLENRPGSLSHVVGTLAKAKVNIRAISINDGVHHGVLKVVPDDAGKAGKALKKAGLGFSEQKVYALSVADRPGGLAEVCSRLAGKGINLDFIYGSACGCADGCDCGCDAVLILSVADGKSAAAALGQKKGKKNKKGGKKR